MGDEEKLSEIVKSAEVVGSVKIPEDQLTSVETIDDFEGFKGKVFCVKGDSTLYKKNGDGWIKFDPKKHVVKKQVFKIQDESARIDKLEESIEAHQAWAAQATDYMDKLREHSASLDKRISKLEGKD